MKKLLSILLAAMLIVACFGMVGCGVKGKYEFYAYEIDGNEYKVGDTFMGVEITEDMVKVMAFELCKDGTVKDADGEVIAGQTWEKADGGIVLKMGDESINVKKDGNKLIMERNGAKTIYKKA